MNDSGTFMRNRHQNDVVMVLYECSTFFYESIQDAAERLLKFHIEREIGSDGDYHWRIYVNGKQITRSYSDDFTEEEVLRDYLTHYRDNFSWANLHWYIQAGQKIPILRSDIER